MKSTRAAMLAAVLAALVMCLVPFQAADADTGVDVTTSDFDTMHGGSIYVDFTGTANEFTATIKVTEGSKVWYEKETQITAGDCSIKIYLGNLKSEGDHSMLITFTPAEGSDGTFAHDSKSFTIHVNKNILSSWTTYLAIAIAVIAIAVIIYMKMRDKPKAENTMTFEQLEEERKAEMAAKSEKRKNKDKGYTAPASSTERKKYTGKKKE